MPRRKRTSEAPPSTPPIALPTVPVIDPRAVYTLETARLTLGLAKHTLVREVRQGRLRVSRRGGKYFLTGAWLLEWLQNGEKKAQAA